LGFGDGEVGMATIRRFEDIEAWKKARELVREVYRACGDGKFSQDYGLRNQICRAAVSSMSNIAEGFGRRSNKDFAHFLDMARGSAAEVQSLLYVALDLNYVGDESFRRLYDLADRTISMIAGFSSYLRENTKP
jgi:four helix bundle protein